MVRVLYNLPAASTTTVDLERIHKALNPAHFVAGIHPQITPRSRQRRAAITEDLCLQDALDKYIANNPHLQERRDALQRVAHELERELELLAPQENAN